MIKDASAADVLDITKFAERYKKEKDLFTDSEFIADDFKQFLMASIYASDSKVFISEDDTGVHGFLIMSMDRVPWNKSQRWASDVLFAAEKEAAQLLKAAIVWGKSKDCWKIFFSNSTGYPQADKFFELMKLRKVGGQYVYIL